MARSSIVDPGERHAADQFVYNYLECVDRLVRHMDRLVLEGVLDDDLLKSALEYRCRAFWWQNLLLVYAQSHGYEGISGSVSLGVWYE